MKRDLGETKLDGKFYLVVRRPMLCIYNVGRLTTRSKLPAGVCKCVFRLEFENARHTGVSLYFRKCLLHLCFIMISKCLHKWLPNAIPEVLTTMLSNYHVSNCLQNQVTNMIN